MHRRKEVQKVPASQHHGKNASTAKSCMHFEIDFFSMLKILQINEIFRIMKFFHFSASIIDG